MPTLLEQLAADGRFSVFVQNQLAATLNGHGPFTIFAPTDTAFAALPADVNERLMSDEDLLVQVLLRHVAKGTIGAELLGGFDNISLMDGSTITSTKIGDNVILDNYVRVVEVDKDASNGLFHAIDQVMLPASLMMESE